MTRKSAALALACAAAVSLPAARAQNAPADTPAAPEAVAPLPELAYDTYFEPFTDNPLYRIHDPQPLTPPPPLFQKFDPLEGLSRPAKVSRVTLPGDRYVASLPVIDAVVGEEITVPVAVQSAPDPVTSIRVFLDYNPEVVVPIGYSGVGIRSEDVFMNPKPAPAYVGDCTNCLIAYNILTYPWAGTGPMLNITFRAVAPGDTNLSVVFGELGDAALNLRPTVYRDGLVRVRAN